MTDYADGFVAAVPTADRETTANLHSVPPQSSGNTERLRSSSAGATMCQTVKSHRSQWRSSFRRTKRSSSPGLPGLRVKPATPA